MMASLLANVEPIIHDLVVLLLDGSLQGAILVVLVWSVCTRMKAVPASARAWLWWVASLKLVMVLVVFPAIPVPVLPSTPQSAVRHAGHRVVDTAALAVPVETMKKLPRAILPSAAAEAAQTVGWRSSIATLAMGITAIWWIALLGMQSVVLVTTHRRLKGLLARSHPVDEHDLQEARRLARKLRLRRAPDVRASDEITSPQAMGIFRPCVLLPTAMTAFNEDERRMMLCHELMHVRRRDLVFGWIPALAERAFFFHPLARLAAREYVLTREAACDAAVLRALRVEPQRYARLLMRLGVAHTDPEFSAAASSPTLFLLRRRLEMLYADASATRSRGWLWPAAVGIALAFLPIHLTARSASSPAERPTITRAVASPVASFQDESAVGRPLAMEDVRFGSSAPTRDASQDSEREKRLQLLRRTVHVSQRQQATSHAQPGDPLTLEHERFLRELGQEIKFGQRGDRPERRPGPQP